MNYILQALEFLKTNELKDEVYKLAEEVRLKGIKGIPVTVINCKWLVNGSQSAATYLQVSQNFSFFSAYFSSNASTNRYSRNWHQGPPAPLLRHCPALWNNHAYVLYHILTYWSVEAV
jgi:hypothetical protein